MRYVLLDLRYYQKLFNKINQYLNLNQGYFFYPMFINQHLLSNKRFFYFKKKLLSSIFQLVNKKLNINEIYENKFHDIIDDEKIFKI